MKNKSQFIQEKIIEIKKKLAKPITKFETGDFKSTGDKKGNWIGRVFLCRPNETRKVLDKNGIELFPLAQFYLPDLPFIPEALKHITWLTVFMGKEFPEEFAENGDGWLIREYTKDDELIEFEYSKYKSPKPFPLNPIFKESDYPLWDDGGMPSDIEDEICELENNDKFDYYDDIVGEEHSYLHKFGGYPSYCQSGMGLFFADDCEFMFQISSDDKAEFNVIDGGSLMFARNLQGKWVIYYDFH